MPPERARFFLELFSEKRRPLSTLVASLDFETLRPFDILLNSKLDILNDACYSTILRMVAIRQIRTIIAAPPCTEYSLLKLKQPGPKPCRLPDRLEEPLYDNLDVTLDFSPAEKY